MDCAGTKTGFAASHRTFDTIAVRLCRHPAVETLCQLAKMPITSTSANLNGQEPCQNLSAGAGSIRRSFPVLQAEVGDAKNPSEVRSLQIKLLKRIIMSTQHPLCCLGVTRSHKANHR
ncbi:Sua5/YciO/YrdC/YwlC family protein [Gallibacterium anatis]|uniref:Sua5/YciO/YrdC/YwlC family protein n=1 Tax=Gallibacterium anatis TaxID=750 RepID=A0A930Y5B3_9PAST|nr:Sua5/YciO/YrdC/YwlC family protein [Gallibacterium anatis]